MKLATTTSDFSTYTDNTYDAIKYVSDSGFKYIDYGFHQDFVLNNGIFSSEPNGYIKSVKELADNRGIKFVQAHAPMGRPIVYDENRDIFVEGTKKCIEACGELGIENIVVHLGYRKGISKEENFLENKKFFCELFETAEKNNVNLLAENFNKMDVEGMYWVDSAEDLAEFISYVNHPLLHACWDAGHGNMQIMPQDEALRLLGQEVYAIHVQDNAGDEDSHLAPYFGTLDLDSLVRGLKEINYKGYFTLEACNIFANSYTGPKKTVFPSVSLRVEAEKFLYFIGKEILMKHGLFEE